MFGARIGMFEGLMMLFMWIPLFILPFVGVWLLWRVANALESIAASLRERK